MTNWQHKRFTELSVAELYNILKLRQNVFVIEQECIYPDIDGADHMASHLFTLDEQSNGRNSSAQCSNEEPSIRAYLRIFAPGLKCEQVCIGRVLTKETARGTGLGRALMQHAIKIVEQEYAGHAIKLSAQLHLKHFYEELKFETVSEPYDEDGIMHIDMLRR